MGTIKGWMQVNDRTAVLMVNGKPTKIRTSSRDFDRAEDAAAQWVGEPLETGEWTPVEPKETSREEREGPWVCDCHLASENPYGSVFALSDCVNWSTNSRGDCGGRVERHGDSLVCETCFNRK